VYLETNLCYIEEEINILCDYPFKSKNCQKCVENASLVDGICQCNEGYSGLGYTYCSKDDGNIFYFLFFFIIIIFFFFFFYLYI